MSSRQFICCVSLVLTMFGLGCSSQDKNGASSLPPSAQSGKASDQPQTPAPTASPQAAKAEPAARHKDDAISYAKNPERFVKQQTYEPPFNITDPKTAQEHFNVGVNLDNKKELDKAIAEYQNALELKPDWALAHFRVAQDYQKEGRTEEAIAHWEQATRYDPQFYAAYDLLAGAYERQGDLEKAIEAYSALLKYPAAQMPADYQLGLWYAQLGNRPKAREHLESYRQLALKVKAEHDSPRFQKALRELHKLEQ